MGKNGLWVKKVHRVKMPNVVKTVLWLKMHKGVKKFHRAKIVYGMKKAIESKCLMVNWVKMPHGIKYPVGENGL